MGYVVGVKKRENVSEFIGKLFFIFKSITIIYHNS